MSIELISDIKQANGGQFPLVDSNDIKGGLYSVDTESEMNSIPVVRLKDGMLCWIKDLKKYMRYDSAENSWVDPNFGTGSSSSSINVVDNLTTISSSSALSANQGYQLNTYKFDDVSLSGYTLSFIANNTVRRFVQLPQYTLPVASDTQLGGVIVGDGLSVNSNGVISSNHIDDIINNLKLSYDSSTATVNLTYNTLYPPSVILI